MHKLTTLFSNLVTFKLCIIMFMQSAPLIGTPIWTSICKPMNSLEVSRIAWVRTDLCKTFLGQDPQTPFQYDSARLSTINTMQVMILHLCIYNKNMHYTLTLHAFFFVLFTF